MIRILNQKTPTFKFGFFVFSFLILCSSESQAQFTWDNFDSYSVGDSIAATAGPTWTTWQNNPGSLEEAVVSDLVSLSSPNSLLLDSGHTDILYLLGNLTTGSYMISFQVYLPDGFGNYFNMQKDETPGIEWANEVFFNPDGTGWLMHDNDTFEFLFPHDQWVSVEYYIDLDNDKAQLWIDRGLVGQWKWSLSANGLQGLKQIGSINFYPIGGFPPVKMFLDDVNLIPSVLPTDISSNSLEHWQGGDSLALLDSRWETWLANVPSLNALIIDSVGSSGTNSLFFNNAAQDMIYLFDNQTTGVWDVGFSLLIESGNSAYYNIQESTSPGTGWMFDGYFDDGGTGSLDAGFGNTVDTFSYPQDQWFKVLHRVDLNTDSISIWIDGVLVHTGTYTVSGSGKQLGAFNFYPPGGSGPGISFFVDDMVYKNSNPTSLLATDYTFERWNQGDYIGAVDGRWTTVSGVTGINEDAMVSGDQSQSGVNSLGFDSPVQDALFLLGNLNTQTWLSGFSMFIPSGNGAYYNIQEKSELSSSGVFECYFDDGGAGRIRVNGIEVETFTFPHDTWFPVEHFFSLDLGAVQLFINNTREYVDSFPSAIHSFRFRVSKIPGTGRTFYLDDMVLGLSNLPPFTRIESFNSRVESNFRLYPNPASDQITVWSGLREIGTLRILDLSGKVFLSNPIETSFQKVGIESLEPGLYIVELQHGGQREVQKLVKL